MSIYTQRAPRSIIGFCIEREMELEAIMSQSELAQKSGVSKGVLNSIITGRTTHPDVWTIVRLADALRCPVDRLLSRGAELVPCLSPREQTVLETYRRGIPKYRKTIDMVVDWNTEEGGPTVAKTCPTCRTAAIVEYADGTRGRCTECGQWHELSATGRWERLPNE